MARRRGVYRGADPLPAGTCPTSSVLTMLGRRVLTSQTHLAWVLSKSMDQYLYNVKPDATYAGVCHSWG
jgi:hypothetical protein